VNCDHIKLFVIYVFLNDFVFSNRNFFNVFCKKNLDDFFLHKQQQQQKQINFSE